MNQQIVWRQKIALVSHHFFRVRFIRRCYRTLLHDCTVHSYYSLKETIIAIKINLNATPCTYIQYCYEKKKIYHGNLSQKMCGESNVLLFFRYVSEGILVFLLSLSLSRHCKAQVTIGRVRSYFWVELGDR